MKIAKKNSRFILCKKYFKLGSRYNFEKYTF